MSEPRWCDLSKKDALAVICQDLPPEVAAAVRKHFRGKPIPRDPMAAINVVLRLATTRDHGNTTEWDKVAAAGGVVLP